MLSQLAWQVATACPHRTLLRKMLRGVLLHAITTCLASCYRMSAQNFASQSSISDGVGISID